MDKIRKSSNSECYAPPSILSNLLYSSFFLEFWWIKIGVDEAHWSIVAKACGPYCVGFAVSTAMTVKSAGSWRREGCQKLSETLADICQTARRHILEKSSLTFLISPCFTRAQTENCIRQVRLESRPRHWPD
jgi:hypothetical protein